LQAQAQQSLSDIIAGRSFQVSPEEQRLIEAQRQSQISLGEQDINKFLDERLQEVVGSAAGRGLRGQALGELQSDVIKQGSEAQARLVGQANLSALQQAQNLPFQRVAAQQPAISQGFTTADLLRQQAFANRQALSSPDLLRQLQQERFAKATRVNETYSPGRQGSTMDGLIGGIQGGLGGFAAGQSIGQGIAGAKTPGSNT
jgi:alkylated DNA nucleotide flippase Atl1